MIWKAAPAQVCAALSQPCHAPVTQSADRNRSDLLKCKQEYLVFGFRRSFQQIHCWHCLLVLHTLEDMLGLKWIIVDHFFIPITELSSLIQTGLGQDFKSYPAIKHGLLGSCLCGEIKVISPSICSSIWFRNLNGKLTFQKCYFFLLIKSTSRRKMWNDWGFSTLKFFHSENEDLNISYPSIKFVNSFCRETHNNKNWLFILMFSQISI